jgi:hypothetical protein
MNAILLGYDFHHFLVVCFRGRSLGSVLAFIVCTSVFWSNYLVDEHVMLVRCVRSQARRSGQTCAWYHSICWTLVPGLSEGRTWSKFIRSKTKVYDESIVLSMIWYDNPPIFLPCAPEPRNESMPGQWRMMCLDVTFVTSDVTAINGSLGRTQLRHRIGCALCR